MVETIGGGFTNGYNWLVDHDNTAGDIGVNVTDNGQPQPGQLLLNGQAFAEPGNTLIGTINPIQIDPFDNQGRHVLFTHPSLKGVVLIVPKGQTPPVGLRIWTAFVTG